MSVVMAGPVGFLSKSGGAVFFGPNPSKPGGTSNVIKRLQNEKNIALWGEDNRFPQNIEQQLAYCGIAKSGLDWKARILYGNGIVPGTITGVDKNGSEIFTPLPRTNKTVYAFLEAPSMTRFWIEYLQDWVWYNNCFPELIFSDDGKSIAKLVHQESCDSRFEQMDDSGKIKRVFLSKLWGASSDQFAKFDPKKPMKGLQKNPDNIDAIEDKYIKPVPCIDMYNPLASAIEIAQKFPAKGLKSAILPTNYPSVNKTYYQVPAWDGARLSGWIEIASKIPSMLKTLYSKAFSIRYHIEVPWTFFEDKYGLEGWRQMDDTAKSEAKRQLLKEMDDALSGDENAYKSFITFYNVTPGTDRKEYGKITVTPVPDTVSLDKELISQSAADIQTLVAMGLDPTLFGAGTIGTGQQRSGGSDKRESYNIYISNLHLERQLLLEPLHLVRDYNREVGGMKDWSADIIFKFRDTVLTTLDKGHGQESAIDPKPLKV